MNELKEKYREIAEKNPILYGTLSYSVFALLIAAGIVLTVFLLLWATGVYGAIETALDLKHNANIILVPLWTAAALSVLCVVSGFLMYFHKYKRPQVNSDFHDALAPALGMEVGKKS